jgi:hypothetical protein
MKLLETNLNYLCHPSEIPSKISIPLPYNTPCPSFSTREDLKITNLFLKYKTPPSYQIIYDKTAPAHNNELMT